MPCNHVNHLMAHTWPTEGVLTIERCEVFCGFCTGAQAGHQWKFAWFTRRHVQTVHIDGGQYPNLTLTKGWSRAPQGNAGGRKPSARRAQKQSLKREFLEKNFPGMETQSVPQMSLPQVTTGNNITTPVDLTVPNDFPGFANTAYQAQDTSYAPQQDFEPFPDFNQMQTQGPYYEQDNVQPQTVSLDQVYIPPQFTMQDFHMDTAVQHPKPKTAVAKAASMGLYLNTNVVTTILPGQRDDGTPKPPTPSAMSFSAILETVFGVAELPTQCKEAMDVENETNKSGSVHEISVTSESQFLPAADVASDHGSSSSDNESQQSSQTENTSVASESEATVNSKSTSDVSFTCSNIVTVASSPHPTKTACTQTQLADRTKAVSSPIEDLKTFNRKLQAVLDVALSGGFVKSMDVSMALQAGAAQMTQDWFDRMNRRDSGTTVDIN